MSLYLMTSPSDSIVVKGTKVTFTYMASSMQAGICVDVLTMFRDIVSWAYYNSTDIKAVDRLRPFLKDNLPSYIRWLNALVRNKSGGKVYPPTLILSGDTVFYEAPDANGCVKASVSVKDALEAIGEYIDIYRSGPSRIILCGDGNGGYTIEQQVILSIENDGRDTISVEKASEEEVDAYRDFHTVLDAVNDILAGGD